MKKKALLLVEALFFAFLTDAAEKEIYVIKDGKITVKAAAKKEEVVTE